MLYTASRPFLFVAARATESRNKMLVRLKRRPKALAQVRIIPEKHFRHYCSVTKLADLWLLSLVSKKATGHYALKVFESTRRMGYLRRDRTFLEQQDTCVVPFRGSDLFVCRYGPVDGPPILLIHGWDANGLMVRPLAQDLAARGYRVIVPDLPGHGASGLERASVYDMAEAVARIMKDCDRPLVSVIGHSTGGIVGALAVHAGLRTASFVSLGIPSSLGELLDINVGLHAMPGCTRDQMGQIYSSSCGRAPEDIGLQLLADRKATTLICHDADDARVPLGGLRAVYEQFEPELVHICNTGSHNGLLKDAGVHRHVAGFLAGQGMGA